MQAGLKLCILHDLAMIVLMNVQGEFLPYVQQTVWSC